MVGTRIVTDSTAGLPADLVQELNITVVPLIVRFGSEALHEGTEITNAEFYHRLTVDPDHPSTSQPSPGEFITAYQSIADDADDIISIHITSELSGTFDSATSAGASDEVAVPVHVVDSRSASIGLGFLAVLAAERARDGVSVPEILQELDAWIQRGRTCFLLDTLEFLHRGGRIGAAQAFLGSLLRVKPVLHVVNGVIEPLDRARSPRKAIDRIVRYIREEADDGPLPYAGLLFSTDREMADRLRERIDAEFEVGRWFVAEIGAVIGAHVGPSAIGVAFPARET
ncbi:MAG: DegV family protein [Chloroflexota bacterium]|nr:DegV family protein [Chloroflexota bacterium]